MYRKPGVGKNGGPTKVKKSNSELMAILTVFVISGATFIISEDLRVTRKFYVNILQRLPSRCPFGIEGKLDRFCYLRGYQLSFLKP